jgi:hypothetical protein
VKTAAPAHGVSDAMRARSSKRVFDALTPTWALPALNPSGYVPDVGTYFFFAGGITPSPGAAYVRICEVKMRFVRASNRALGRVRDMLGYNMSNELHYLTMLAMS